MVEMVKVGFLCSNHENVFVLYDASICFNLMNMDVNSGYVFGYSLFVLASSFNLRTISISWFEIFLISVVLLSAHTKDLGSILST